MSVRSRSSRFVLWAAMCALLLKAAVPLLASAAAAAQGKSVAEVCTIYGVALPDARAQDGADPHAHHHGHQHAGGGGHPHDSGEHDGSHVLAHHADHCALSALAALATPAAAPQPGVPLTAVGTAAPAVALAPAAAPDTCALWVARLKQGPPALA